MQYLIILALIFFASQARPISAASTGFSHLDEFERKLAEMESELDHEVEWSDDVDDGIGGDGLDYEVE